MNTRIEMISLHGSWLATSLARTPAIASKNSPARSASAARACGCLPGTLVRCAQVERPEINTRAALDFSNAALVVYPKHTAWLSADASANWTAGRSRTCACVSASTACGTKQADGFLDMVTAAARTCDRLHTEHRTNETLKLVATVGAVILVDWHSYPFR